MLVRVRAVLIGLWLGLVAGLALVVAPTLFAVLDRQIAGQVAGAMFRIEAHVALGLAAALFLIERHLSRAVALQGQKMPIAGMLLILGALFCTVLGYFGLQPMMEAAKAGVPGSVSFGLLHGLSSSLFALKGLLLLVALWRVAGTLPARTSV
jgi:hypothetical protein